MARLDSVHPDNIDGDWFVDTRCIDCDTCRQLAPALFGRVWDQSVVVAQPRGAAGDHDAWLAAEACPTQSIGTKVRRARPAGLYPLDLGGGVSYLGHNSPDSYGAWSYLVERPEGNLLVDSPRFTRQLAEPIAERGGIAAILLTHQDDVADADRWAERFGARVWIHEADAAAAPYATDVLRGTEPTVVRPGLVAVPVPGHTRGSVAFVLEDHWCFTGDSLHWNGSDLDGHRGATWYSWAEQGRSLARLAAAHRFRSVLPGHGGRVELPAEEMHERLAALAARMAPDGAPR